MTELDLTNFHLIRGELRNGNIGFHCSGGRKYIFHHLFSDDSGSCMDIGPCEGESCPFAQTHEPGNRHSDGGIASLETRRITLDHRKRPATYMLPGGWQEAEEARMSQRHGLDDDASLEAAMGAVRDLAAASGRFPLLTSWLAQPAGPSADEQFDLGLGFLLDGIATHLVW